MGNDEEKKENTMRWNEKALGSLFENTRIGLFRARLDGSGLLKFNNKFLDIFGLTAEEAIGKPAEHFWANPLRRREMVALLQAGGRVSDFECQLLHKNGEVRDCLLSANRYPEPGVFDGFVLDITERKRFEERARIAAKEWQTTFDSISDMVSIYDKDFKIIRVNKAFARTLHIEPKEVIGKTHAEVFHGVNEPVPNCVCVKISQAQAHVTREYFEPRFGMYLEVTASPIFNKDGEVVAFVHVARDITERQQVEEALREERDKAKSYLDVAGTIIVAIDSKGVVTLMNKKGHEVLGYREGEALGKNWFDYFIPEKHREEVKSVFQKLMTGQIVDTAYFENPVITKSGGERIIFWHNKILTDKTGNIIGILSSGEDITEKRKVEEQLRFSDAAFKSIYEGIIAVDGEDKITYWNGMSEQLFGYKAADVIGAKIFDIINPVERYPGHFEESHRVIAEQGYHRDELVFDTPRGKLWTDVTVREIRRDSVREGLILTYLDITARKAAEEELRFSDAAFRSLHESIIAVDNENKVIYWNDISEQLLGLKKSEVIGKSVFEVTKYIETRAGQSAELDKKIADRGLYRDELLFRTPRGEVWMDTTVHFIEQDGKRYGYVLTGLDVTGRKKMEGELRAHRDHLEELIAERTTQLEAVNAQLERELGERKRIEDELRVALRNAGAANQAKSDFLARMSHEIRTPIHGVMGILDLLSDTELEQEQSQYVTMARNSSETLLSVINGILDFSKIEAGKIKLENKDFNLNILLEEILESLALSAHKKGLEILLKVSGGVPTALVGDAGRLRQILVNLLNNAIKFTERGEILLSVDVEFNSLEMAGLHFSVRDTGIGVPKEKQELLFRPFEQVEGSASRKYSGSGLGLAICRQLINLMGGHIWFASGQEKGSVFHFVVKLDKQPFTRCADNSPEIPADLRSLPLLLVDDNATCRSILQDSLSVWGFQVREAENGPQALKELEKAVAASRQFPVVLVDKTMPSMNGFALAAQILCDPASRPAVIMMLTSDSLKDDVARCRELGISQYLVKPVKQSKLLEAILASFGHAPVVKEVKQQMAPASPPRRLRILVAEDNITSQLIARKNLEREGHTVQIAGNGVEAVHLLKDGNYDLVLMDVEMPEMSGLDATRLIRKAEQSSGEHIPIIAMTAYAMKEDREKCLEAGIDAYFAKPINVTEINNFIRALPSAPNKSPATTFDLATALKMVGGDADILREVVGVFLGQDYPEQLCRLREGINQKDAAVIRAAAHAIKGASGIFGGIAVRTAALSLEEMGRHNDLARADEALKQLEQEVQEFARCYAVEANRK